MVKRPEENLTVLIEERDIEIFFLRKQLAERDIIIKFMTQLFKDSIGSK